MNVDLAILAKLAAFERSTDAGEAQELYSIVIYDAHAEKYLSVVSLTRTLDYCLRRNAGHNKEAHGVSTEGFLFG